MNSKKTKRTTKRPAVKQKRKAKSARVAVKSFRPKLPPVLQRMEMQLLPHPVAVEPTVSRIATGIVRGQLMLAILLTTFGLGFAVFSQIPLGRKLFLLETEIRELRLELAKERQKPPLPAPPPTPIIIKTEFPPAPAPQPQLSELQLKHAIESVLKDWSKEERLRQQPIQVAPVQKLSAKPKTTQKIPAKSVPVLNLPTKPIPAESLPTAQKTEQRSFQLVEVVSDEELDTVVAGAGIPTPGAPSGVPTIAGLTPPTEGQQAINRLSPKVEKGGVLLPKGKFQMEPSVSYSHLSNNRVGLNGFAIFDVIFIGEIQADQIKRDVVAPSLNMRYGIAENFQTDLEIPAHYMHEQTFSGSIDDRQTDSASDMGLSQMGAGLYYQFMHEDGNIPNLIAQMKLKAPTADGSVGADAWGMKGGLVVVKTSDPVALFANTGYTVNFPAETNGHQIDQGDAFDYSLGIAYALNYNLAINGSFEQIFIGQSSNDGSPIADSGLIVANFKSGLTYALTKALSLDLSVAMGLTEDSPDLTVSFTLPYTF